MSEKGTRISNILATRRETVGTLKQQVRDHEKRIIHRNQMLNDALRAWNFDTVESDVPEIGIFNIYFYIISIVNYFFLFILFLCVAKLCKNFVFTEVKALTKRLEDKMRALEKQVEENRLIMQKKENEFQKEVDTLRSNYSKIESEKVLKENEVTEIRDEIDAIRNQITQVNIILLRILK